jgi:hypothetical protein
MTEVDEVESMFLMLDMAHVKTASRKRRQVPAVRGLIQTRAPARVRIEARSGHELVELPIAVG